MSFALLLLAATFSATVNADYFQTSQYYTSSTCAGTATTTTFLYMNGCQSYNGGSNKAVCSNSSYGVFNSYSTPDCSGSATSSSSISGFPWGCTASSQSMSYQGSCVTGDYTAPTSGVITKSGYTDVTCPVASKPNQILMTQIGVCMTSGLSSGKYSCFNSTHSAATVYASTDCSGTVVSVVYSQLGCSIDQYGVTVRSCSTTSSGAASISVALLSLLSVVFAMATLM
jgi:hypothetical protein